MCPVYFFSRNFLRSLPILITGFLPLFLNAQQLKITDFALFGGSGLCPSCTVNIGTSSSITGGSIGSYHLIQSTGNASITGNIYSGGTIILANGNTVGGRISAANTAALTGTILNVGSSAKLNGNIDVNGNIVVSGGMVSGMVTHPPGTTYTGPTPGMGNVIGTPGLPALPVMPVITVFPPAGTMNITATQNDYPGCLQ